MTAWSISTQCRNKSTHGDYVHEAKLQIGPAVAMADLHTGAVCKCAFRIMGHGRFRLKSLPETAA